MGFYGVFMRSGTPGLFNPEAGTAAKSGGPTARGTSLTRCFFTRCWHHNRRRIALSEGVAFYVRSRLGYRDLRLTRRRRCLRVKRFWCNQWESMGFYGVLEMGTPESRFGESCEDGRTLGESWWKGFGRRLVPTFFQNNQKFSKFILTNLKFFVIIEIGGAFFCWSERAASAA